MAVLAAMEVLAILALLAGLVVDGDGEETLGCEGEDDDPLTCTEWSVEDSVAGYLVVAIDASAEFPDVGDTGIDVPITVDEDCDSVPLLAELVNAKETAFCAVVVVFEVCRPDVELPPVDVAITEPEDTLPAARDEDDKEARVLVAETPWVLLTAVTLAEAGVVVVGPEVLDVTADLVVSVDKRLKVAPAASENVLEASGRALDPIAVVEVSRADRRLLSSGSVELCDSIPGEAEVEVRLRRGLLVNEPVLDTLVLVTVAFNRAGLTDAVC
jgi:hypothetical protein